MSMQSQSMFTLFLVLFTFLHVKNSTCQDLPPSFPPSPSPSGEMLPPLEPPSGSEAEPPSGSEVEPPPGDAPTSSPPGGDLTECLVALVPVEGCLAQILKGFETGHLNIITQECCTAILSITGDCLLKLFHGAPTFPAILKSFCLLLPNPPPAILHR